MSEIKVPVFPESITEGEVSTWRKAVGDSFTEGEVLVEIETDKVVMEVPAVGNGVITEILKAEGDVVGSQEVIGRFTAAGAAVAKNTPATQTVSAPKSSAEKDDKKAAPAAASVRSGETGPATRRLLNEHGLQASQVAGSGKEGRITPQDVNAHVVRAESASAAPVKAVLGARTEERVPMTRLRQTIAKRLLEVQSTNAILTTFNEVDMHAVMNMRSQYKDQFEQKHGVRLGFMSFFLKATTEALKRFPVVNASIDGKDIIYHGFYDIGVAVSSPRGLVVPVIRNVDQMSLAEIEKQIGVYANQAKEGSLSIEDMQGGTFTVTNGGVFGSMLSTPIINPPQSAILGMHNIVERPVVVKGQIVIRPIMYLALSYDHRIIDGRDSVSFLKTVKELIEDPARLLLAV